MSEMVGYRNAGVGSADGMDGYLYIYKLLKSTKVHLIYMKKKC